MMSENGTPDSGPGERPSRQGLLDLAQTLMADGRQHDPIEDVVEMLRDFERETRDAIIEIIEGSAGEYGHWLDGPSFVIDAIKQRFPDD